MVHHRGELEPDLADDLRPQLQRGAGVLPVVLAKFRPRIGSAAGDIIVDGGHHRPRCLALAGSRASTDTLQRDCGGTGSARRWRRSFLLRLEPRDRRTDRRERAVFVLLLAEAVGIGAVGRIDRLLQQVGEVLVEPGLARPRLRDDIGRDVPGLLHRELRVQVVGAVRHVEMDEVRRRDQPRHAGAVVEAVAAPQRRDHVAEIGGRQAAADAGAVGVVAGEAGGGVDRLPARGIGGALEFRHPTDAEARSTSPGATPVERNLM